MKVHFTTLGCPKNQVDSELMLGLLARAGHEITERVVPYLDMPVQHGDELDGLTLGTLWSDNSVTRGEA